ncbi:THAP domain-containing protein 6 isoform X2 [Nannospalax galili]|uniref:THAP domain-containing protein 6 isoform X2 n=1 Tax=Nannospalax galili TaxID=1026970 RepID=UPI00111BF115|nr:THAP domain-containing protein 6 isoform X2 [Nannospalax galili]
MPQWNSQIDGGENTAVNTITTWRNTFLLCVAKIMVKCCSAIGCASRCLPNSKLKGLTFHVFPTDENIKRKWVLAMKRLDVNAADIWEPKKGDVLCSRHFKKTDFDRSTPNIKLKPGVIPSVFDSPYHLQEKREKLHCRKNFILKPLPVTNHNYQLVGASCIEEFQSQFIFNVVYGAGEVARWLKPLSYKYEDWNSDAQNPHTCR